MTKVVSLEAYRGRKDQGFFSGPARCTACKHEWVGVAPAGALDLECPECGALRGIFKFQPGFPVGCSVWTCLHCDDTFMRIGKYPDGSYSVMCGHCGLEHKPSDVFR